MELIIQLLRNVVLTILFDIQVVLPRVLHAPLAVVGDVYVLKLGTHLFGKRAGKYAVSRESISNRFLFSSL